MSKNHLVLLVFLFMVLLLVCVSSVDASSTITSKQGFVNMSVGNEDVVLRDGVYYVGLNGTGKAVLNETVTVEPKYKTVTITAKPSCGCNYREPSRYKYKWYTRSFIDYCPKCGCYNVLRNVYKPTARYEYELTCTHCDADYCGVCGKDKFSWSHYYITLAS